MSKSPHLQQEIRSQNVVCEVTGFLGLEGKSLIATRDIPPRSQVLFVQQPLTLALDSARLQNTCYQCLRTTDQGFNAPLRPSRSLDLKSCTGCKTVKFCDKTCQKLAWNRFHKHECKIFTLLYPRCLPTFSRAAIRLFLLRTYDLLPEGEWKELLDLEAHLDDLKDRHKTRWEDMVLMAKAVHEYSGTSESYSTVLKLCCILSINSMTLTDPLSEPLGAILHPLPSRINHSCEPNAYVRFDVPSPDGAISGQSSRVSSSTISVHALQKIPKGKEITISYIDPTLPTQHRQSELSDRYFFKCKCQRCLMGQHAITDMVFDQQPPNVPVHSKANKGYSEQDEDKEATCEDEIDSEINSGINRSSPAIATLQLFDSPSSASLSVEERIHKVRVALALLAFNRNWPAWRYPSPQLRTHLISLLVSQFRYSEALSYALYMSSPIDKALFESNYQPTRLQGKWRVYQLCRLCLLEKFETDKSLPQKWHSEPRDSEVKMLAALMIATIYDLAGTVCPEEYNRITSQKGKKQETAKERDKQTRNMKGGKNGTSSAKSTSTDTPPPYIGPETAPDALPTYSNSSAPIPTYAESQSQTNENPTPTPTGAFEALIASALEQLVSGDGQPFWTEYQAGRLPSVDKVKMWVPLQFNEMLARERGYG